MGALQRILYGSDTYNNFILKSNNSTLRQGLTLGHQTPVHHESGVGFPEISVENIF